MTPPIPDSIRKLVEGRTVDQLWSGLESMGAKLAAMREELDEKEADPINGDQPRELRRRVEEQLIEARARLSALDAEHVAARAAENLEATKAIEAERDETRAAFRKWSAELAEAKARKALALEDFEDMKSTGACCSRCTSKLTKEQRGARQAQLVHEIDAYKRGIEGTEAKVAECRTAAAAQRERFEALKAQAFQIEREETELGAASKRVAQLERELAEIYVPENNGLAELRAKIEKGEGLHAQLSAYLDALVPAEP